MTSSESIYTWGRDAKKYPFSKIPSHGRGHNLRKDKTKTIFECFFVFGICSDNWKSYQGWLVIRKKKAKINKGNSHKNITCPAGRLHVCLGYVNLVFSAFHLPDERPWEQGWVFLFSSVQLIKADSCFCGFWLCGLVALNFLQAIQPGRSRTDTSRFKRGRKM